MLQIQGISDWSVERVVEQSICKGNTVILHLEENPRDVTMQKALFECIDKMVNKMDARYPEYKANLIFVCTSNYPPEPSLLQEFGHNIIKSPPRVSRRVLIELILISSF